jgi:hypothetical protein
MVIVFETLIVSMLKVSMYMRAQVCVCVCACVRAREREREREMFLKLFVITYFIDKCKFHSVFQKSYEFLK